MEKREVEDRPAHRDSLRGLTLSPELALLASIFCSPHHQARTCNLGTHRQLGYLLYLEAPKLCLKIILRFLRETGWGKTSGMKYIQQTIDIDQKRKK